MIKTDWSLRAILASIVVGLALIATGMVYSTFFKNTADAKVYKVTKFAACNAYLPSGTKPWCAEVRTDGGDKVLAVTR
jgi:ABC-type Fe3+-siderophore transport system permease subunit